jgi:hypothetical protein
MRSILEMVADVFVHQALEMALVLYDHVIEQFAAAAADESLGDAVLPRTLEADSLRLASAWRTNRIYAEPKLPLLIQISIFRCR